MKIYYNVLGLSLALGGGLHSAALPLWGGESQSLDVGSSRATVTVGGDGDLRIYQLKTTMTLRENNPPGKLVTFAETPDHPTIRTGNFLFDGLYAMAISEALANSVPEISDAAYADGTPMKIDAFQTGELWKYVWTRDLSYSVNLALAGFDPQRSADSLLFKTSTLKASVVGGLANQIIQDTGSGGSYPVSSDRIVWALGASETMKYLAPTERDDFLQKAYPILRDTIEQDRRVTYDPADGLYRGEQSFPRLARADLPRLDEGQRDGHRDVEGAFGQRGQLFSAEDDRRVRGANEGARATGALCGVGAGAEGRDQRALLR